jgi:hypothetical protein
MKPKRKARPARIDADRKAKPLTKIIAHLPPGKLSFPENVERYEVVDSDPNPSNGDEGEPT